MLNGFMTGTDVALSGIAAGNISVKGTTDRPVLNGSLDLDSAHIYSDVYGFDFRTDEQAVEIKDSRMVFTDYNLYSTGKNPLVLNGSLDMSDFSRIALDFSMKANDFELINTRKKSKSMVFGKVYANYLGTIKGTVDNLAMRGKLEVLDRTDVTYVLKDSPSPWTTACTTLCSLSTSTTPPPRPKRRLRPKAASTSPSASASATPHSSTATSATTGRATSTSKAAATSRSA